jgi:hypothetical protein
VSCLDIQQKSTEYKPTNAEEKLLEVLLNPESQRKSVTDICAMADCDRGTYYNAFNKPEFVALYKKKTSNLIKGSVSQIVNAFVQQAKRGSFTHGKVILDMSKMFDDSKGTDNSGMLPEILEYMKNKGKKGE